MQRILAAMAERAGPSAVNFDFVLVAGHFLARDENIFTFFEGQGLRTYEASKALVPPSFSKQVTLTHTTPPPPWTPPPPPTPSKVGTL